MTTAEAVDEAIATSASSRASLTLRISFRDVRFLLGLVEPVHVHQARHAAEQLAMAAVEDDRMMREAGVAKGVEPSGDIAAVNLGHCDVAGELALQRNGSAFERGHVITIIAA